ncbi:hypothetical protein [Microbacterium sp. SS28]|uniref:hypothetical protein n=1 Tax=Microbacterium sp. SS28 TaxID=2919948 RepID=UPI001FAA8A02|nr:hypothetical protein [Microbacterium sp. SS28]
MSIRLRRIAFAASIAVAAALLSACAADAGDATGVSVDELCADALVVECRLGDGSTVVVIDGDAPSERITAFARELHSATATQPGTVVLRGSARDAVALDPEVAAPSAWEATVQPSESAQFDAALSGILAAAAVPGAAGIVVADGWPYVTVETLDQFETVFAEISATPLFENGGTYTLQSLDEHLRIVHVPARTTDDGILEIIDIARDHPAAEVLLEAPTSGPQYPRLFVSRLSPEEAQALDLRLRAPRLATADVDGFPLEYVLGSLGETGTTYIGGTFGAVPG